jgi:GTPase SAR1 family protein
MLVFDVTNEQSFGNIRNWMTDINKHVEKATVQKILVGNKADAADTVRLQLISAQPAAATASASLAPTLFAAAAADHFFVAEPARATIALGLLCTCRRIGW